MITNGSEKICHLEYLTGLMGGKKELITGMIDDFLKQLPEELQYINNAIATTDYPVIKNYAHTMKSTASIMGIAVLTPILNQMENLAAMSANAEKIKELTNELNSICKQAIEELGKEKLNYI